MTRLRIKSYFVNGAEISSGLNLRELVNDVTTLNNGVVAGFFSPGFSFDLSILALRWTRYALKYHSGDRSKSFRAPILVELIPLIYLEGFCLYSHYLYGYMPIIWYK